MINKLRRYLLSSEGAAADDRRSVPFVLTVGTTALAVVLAGCGASVSQDATGSESSAAIVDVKHDFTGLERVTNDQQGKSPRVRSVAVQWRNQGRMPVSVAVTAYPATTTAARLAGRRADKLDFDVLVDAPVGAARGEKVTRILRPAALSRGQTVTADYQLLLSRNQSNLLRNYARHYRKSTNVGERQFADQLASRYTSVIVRHSRDVKDQGKSDPGHDYLLFAEGRHAVPAQVVRAVNSKSGRGARKGSSAPTSGTTSLPDDTATSETYDGMRECAKDLRNDPGIPVGGSNESELCNMLVDGVSDHEPPLLERAVVFTNSSQQALALNGQPVACMAASGPNAYLSSQQLSPDDQVNGQWMVDGAAVEPPATPTPSANYSGSSVYGDNSNVFYILNDTVLQPNQAMAISIQKMRTITDSKGVPTAEGTLADQDSDPSADVVTSVSAFWQMLGQVNQARASGADGTNIYEMLPQPATARQLPMKGQYNPEHDKYALNWAQAMPAFWSFLSSQAGTQSGETVKQLQEQYALAHPDSDKLSAILGLVMNVGMMLPMLIPGLGEVATIPMMAMGVAGIGEAITNVVSAYEGSSANAGHPNCKTGLFQVGATGFGNDGFPFQATQIYEIDATGNISPHDGQGAYMTNGIAISQYGSNWENVFNQILANNISTQDDYRAVSESQKQQWAANPGESGPTDDSMFFFSDAVAPTVRPGRDLSNPSTDRSDAYSSSLPEASSILSQIGWVNDFVESGQQANPNNEETVTCAAPIYEWPGPSAAFSQNPSALTVDTASNAGGNNLVVGSGVQTGLSADNKFQSNGNGVSVFTPAGGAADINPDIRWANGSNNTPTGDPTDIRGALINLYETQISGQSAVSMMPAFNGQQDPEKPQNYFFYADPSDSSSGANTFPTMVYPYAPGALPDIDTNISFNCITGVRYGLLVNPEALIISNLGFGPRSFYVPSPQLTVAYSRKNPTNKPSINTTPVTLTKTYSTAWLQSGMGTDGANPLTDSSITEKYLQGGQAAVVPGSVITLKLPAPTAGDWQMRSGGQEIARDTTDPQNPVVTVRVIGEPGSTTNVIYTSGQPGQGGSPPNCAGKVAVDLYNCEAAVKRDEATFVGLQVPLVK